LQHAYHATLPFLKLTKVVTCELEYKYGYTKVNIKNTKWIDNIRLVLEIA